MGAGMIVSLPGSATDKLGAVARELGLSRSEPVRRLWSWLRDRRINAYGGLSQRYLDR